MTTTDYTSPILIALVALGAVATLWILYANHRDEAARRDQQQFAEQVRKTHSARQNLEP